MPHLFGNDERRRVTIQSDHVSLYLVIRGGRGRQLNDGSLQQSEYLSERRGRHADAQSRTEEAAAGKRVR